MDVGAKRSWLSRLVIAGVVLLAVWNFGDGSGGGDSAAPDAAASDSAPETNTEPTTAPDVGEQLSTWLDTNGYVLDEIISVGEQISSAASAYDMEGIIGGCAQMKHAALLGLDSDDIPVPSVQLHWNVALQHYLNFGNLCLRGDLAESIDEANAGASELALATDAIKELVG